MVISIKDGVKLFVLSIVCFCAVFVCTFFINYYLDTSGMEVPTDILSLYDAQRKMAKFTCFLTGGFLAAIAAVILFFYIKLYVNEHTQNIGILKAMGYSNGRLSLSFTVFGASVFVGTALGFAMAFALMPVIYKGLTIEGMPEVIIHFRVTLLILLVVVPTLVFGGAACLFSLFALKKPPLEMMRGGKEIKSKPCKKSENSFLIQMCKSVLSSKKLLAFFVAFSCFCFSSMVQMSIAMLDMDAGLMSVMILVIGIVLAIASMYMSVESMINANKDSVALMKAFGYTGRERTLSVFGGYLPFGVLGFVVGTVYQHFLLKLMMTLIYADVDAMPNYSFGFGFLGITFAAFLVLYGTMLVFFIRKFNKTTLKNVIMQE